MKGIHSAETDKLFETLLKLRTVDECYDFFEDLCTIKEIKDMSQRLQIACLLNKGLSYQRVAEMTNVSSATISRVNRSLNYGNDSYDMVLERMKKK